MANKEILRTLASQPQGLGEAVTAALAADLPDDATRGRKSSRNSGSAKGGSREFPPKNGPPAEK